MISPCLMVYISKGEGTLYSLWHMRIAIYHFQLKVKILAKLSPPDIRGLEMGWLDHEWKIKSVFLKQASSSIPLILVDRFRFLLRRWVVYSIFIQCVQQ